MIPAIKRAKTSRWGTPTRLFAELDREFGFTLDVCADPELAKCPRYFTDEDDGLAQSWAGEVCWMNPPYGMKPLYQWVERAAHAARCEGSTVVALVPVRSEQPWWHTFVWDAAAGRTRPGVEIRFIKGRVYFAGAKYNAPFPCAVIVFSPHPSE